MYFNQFWETLIVDRGAMVMDKNKRKILIVEDEYVNREIVKNILKDDYEIFEAEDGETALELLNSKKNSLSLILLDLFLPKLSGLEILNIIQSNPELNNIPVIVLTSDKELEVQCLQYGASDFISKPYPDSSIIKARINRVVELFEDRQTIKSTERDALTRLYTKEYFYKYVADEDKLNPNSIWTLLRLELDHSMLLKSALAHLSATAF